MCMKWYALMSFVLIQARYADNYWEGMFQMLRNEKQKALEIVAAITAGKGEQVACTWRDDAQNIDHFFEQLFYTFIEHDPQTLSALGLFEMLGVTEHNAYLTDISIAARQQMAQKIKEQLQKLQEYKITGLTPEQKISHAVSTWELEHTVRGEQFLYHTYPVNQLFGVLFDLNFLFTQIQRLETDQDKAHYVARLEKIPEQLAHVRDFMAHQKNSGIVPPTFALEKVIKSIDALLPADVHQHVFYQRVADMSIAPAVARILQERVYPAYRMVQEFCRDLLPKSQNTGVWALPHGDEYYAHALQHHTSTNLTADEVHELGLHEVQKIQREIRELLAAEGIVDDACHVIALLKAHDKDPKFYYPETAQGRAQCIADFEKILARGREILHPLFSKKPKTSVVVKEVPAHEAEGAPGAYYCAPNCDGSRPGMFFVNTRTMSEMPHYRMETLAVHEAEPGHHFQIALQQELDLPAFRKFLRSDLYNAYVEGWALYTEKLAYEQGFYSSNWSKIGHLQDELMRAVRLVVDTGIHKKRWTREQAIAYMERELGMHHDSVVTEIERYFVLPGQACSYKIGQLKLLELRAKMRNALGDRFDLRVFHDLVLSLGAAPLTVLEDVIDAHIAVTTLTVSP